MGRGEAAAVFIEQEAAGPQQPEVHPDGGGTGSAVEGEGDRAAGQIRSAVLRVGDIENGGGGLLLVVADDDGDGDSSVVQFLAVDRDAMLGFDQLLFGLSRSEEHTS